MKKQVQVAPVVNVVNNQTTTTSQNIAKVFGKDHKNILQKIQNLDVPEEFTRLNFQPSEYTDSTGRKLPMFNLTRDGFTILVMGFTGAKAMKFKLAYIEAFNKMEAALSVSKHIPMNSVETIIPFPVNAIDSEVRASWKICVGCRNHRSKYCFGKKCKESPHSGFCHQCMKKLRSGQMDTSTEAEALLLWQYQHIRPVAKKIVDRYVREL